MVDAIGGVPINIPVTITDPWIGTVYPAGQQTSMAHSLLLMPVQYQTRIWAYRTQ